MAKRGFPFHVRDHQHDPKRFRGESVNEDKGFYDKYGFVIETLLRVMVRDAVEKTVEPYLILDQSSSRSLTVNYQTGEEDVGESRTVKLKLRFMNKIPPVIFTNDDVEAENGEPLRIALFDPTNCNDIDPTDPLLSALIEFVVIDGEFDSTQRDDEVHWSVDEFKKGILIEREGKRPLLVGNDLRVGLENGVAVIKHLRFTDNSSWRRSKTFRLGVRIIDNDILAKYPRIGEAISKPFRVMDNRGQVIKKNHPPKGEDEVWRLKGIGKDGKYHKSLSSKGIKSVEEFKNAYKKDSRSLRKLLGNKVPNKTWKAMVDNALECDSPTTCYQTLEVGNPQIIISDSHVLPQTGFDGYQGYDFTLEDFQSLLSHGEALTSNNRNDTNMYDRYNQQEPSWCLNPSNENDVIK
ncbi:calmodulin-binding protein 60 A-like isoform X1 [Cucurbita moschata]|uniref:Calmodulin-binding protein 60 A-like isoform X1 n=1 Tax=Cucurbita moschata TaxID=3662 RepID=A0A6J1HC45_CUCMO|nr:calmodulin-binding protein 60 A-like isoform X1 [Cucurbita moschata]